MRPGFTNFLALFVATVAGIPSFRGMHVLEQRLDVPDGFVKSAPAPGTDIVNLRLALKQANITGLQHMLLDISTPGHALYGRSLTNDEVRSITKRYKIPIFENNYLLRSNHSLLPHLRPPPWYKNGSLRTALHRTSFLSLEIGSSFLSPSVRQTHSWRPNSLFSITPRPVNSIHEL